MIIKVRPVITPKYISLNCVPERRPSPLARTGAARNQRGLHVSHLFSVPTDTSSVHNSTLPQIKTKHCVTITEICNIIFG